MAEAMISLNPAPLLPVRCLSRAPGATFQASTGEPFSTCPPSSPFDPPFAASDNAGSFTTNGFLGSGSLSNLRRDPSDVFRSNGPSYPFPILLLRNITSASSSPGFTLTRKVLSSSHFISFFSRPSSLEFLKGEGGASSFPFAEVGLSNMRDD